MVSVNMQMHTFIQSFNLISILIFSVIKECSEQDRSWPSSITYEILIINIYFFEFWLCL